MKKILFALVAVATLATLAAPAPAQPPEAPPGSPNTPPGLAKKAAEEAVAQDAPEEALRILGRHTYVLEESGSSGLPAHSNGRGKQQFRNGNELKVGLTRSKGSPKATSQPGIVKVDSGDPDSELFVQTIGGDRGLRVMVTLEGPNAPTEHRFDLELEPGDWLMHTDDGGTGVIRSVDGVDVVAATILEPWAIDANGNTVPVTQTVTETEILLSVDTAGVSAWPVIADPTFQDFVNGYCASAGGNTATHRYGNAMSYARGWVCAEPVAYWNMHYLPVWIGHFDRWAVGRPNGDVCTGIPNRQYVWGWPFGWGVVYDFEQACRVHDYLWDLGMPSRQNYPYVTQSNSNDEFRDLMTHDCQNRNPWFQTDCFLWRASAYEVVGWGTWWG